MAVSSSSMGLLRIHKALAPLGGARGDRQQTGLSTYVAVNGRLDCLLFVLEQFATTMYIFGDFLAGFVVRCFILARHIAI